MTKMVIATQSLDPESMVRQAHHDNKEKLDSRCSLPSKFLIGGGNDKECRN